MSSFNVTWQSGKMPSGTVIARKRKPKTDIVNKNKKLTKLSNNKGLKAEKQVNIKQKYDKPMEIQSDTNLVNTPDTTKATKLVKRKKKKDKLLAKLAAENQQTLVHIIKTKDHSLFSVGSKDVYVKSNLKGKSLVEKVFSGSKQFCDLDIHKYIVSNLEKIGYTTLTNVQEKSIPVVLSGKNVLVSHYLLKCFKSYIFLYRFVHKQDLEKLLLMLYLS